MLFLQAIDKGPSMPMSSPIAFNHRRSENGEMGPRRSGAGFMGLVLVGACALTLSACVSAKEQRAMDQDKCVGFGFEAGTDAFAQCMMGVSQQRDALRQNEQLARQARISAQNQEDERRRALYRALSQQRSGDKSFPVCGAGSGGGLDVQSGTWAGPNCRAR